MSTHKTTNQVAEAIRLLDPDTPFSREIKELLMRAHSEAEEQEEYWREEGKPYLRTFLKTTPLGLAIVDLAASILAVVPQRPYTHAHTREWCGNRTCREN